MLRLPSNFAARGSTSALRNPQLRKKTRAERNRKTSKSVYPSVMGALGLACFQGGGTIGRVGWAIRGKSGYESVGDASGVTGRVAWGTRWEMDLYCQQKPARFEIRTFGSSPVRNPKNATRMRLVSPETVDHEASAMAASDDKLGLAGSACAREVSRQSWFKRTTKCTPGRFRFSIFQC